MPGRASRPLRYGTPATTPPAGDPPPADDPPRAEEEEAELPPPEPAAAEQEEGPSAAAPDLDLDELKRVWPAVLQKLSETAPALAATFEGAHPVALDDEGLKVGFPKDKTFNKRKAEEPERRDAVAAAFESVVGQSFRPTYVLHEGDSEASAAPAETEPAAGIDEDAVMRKLKNEFDAEEVG